MANVIYVDGDLFKVGKEIMEEEIKKTGEVTETDETVTEAEAVTNEVSADDTWFKRWKKKRAAKKEAQRKKDEAKGFWQNFFETVLYFAIVILVALSIKKWIGQPVIVSGSSMNDTLNNYNFVWTNKIKYTPKRFDVVTIKSKKTNNDMYIKRVVALPGETIYVDLDEKIHIIPEGGTLADSYVLEDPYGYFDDSIHLANISINGEVARKTVLNKVSNKMIELEDGTKIPGYVCGENEYFVMGDNRRNSQDSRSLGGFTRKEIVGHAVFRIWPLNKLGDFDKSNK